MPRKPKEENDQLAKAIGTRLEFAMKRRGVTVSDLHKLTGISRTVLLAYSRGNYAPGARELKLLCEHLDTTPTFLLFGSEDVVQSPYRIGDIAVTSSVARTMTYVCLLGQLSQTEQRALLTLAEGLLEARDPKAHKQIVAAVQAIISNKEMQDAFSEIFSAMETNVEANAQALEAEINARIGVAK